MSTHTHTDKVKTVHANPSLKYLEARLETAKLSTNLARIEAQCWCVLTYVTNSDYVSRRRTEIKQLNKYNRKLHCFFIFMILALVCLIQNWGGWLQVWLIEQYFTLSAGSFYYKTWSTSKQQITTNFYLFNITNPEEILNGAKPKLEEIGPFTYKIRQVKQDFKIRPNTDTSTRIHDHPTIGYRSKLIYSDHPKTPFDPEKVNITHINIPMLELKSKLGMLQKMRVYNMRDEEIFQTRPVKNWLWGYKQNDLTNLSKTATDLLGSPLSLKEKFALMDSLANNTIIAETEIFQGKTAENDTSWSKQMEVATYLNKLNADCWNDKNLDSFKGAVEGLGVGPMVLKKSDRNSKIQVYRSEFMHKVNYTEHSRELKHFGLLNLKIMKPVPEPVEDKFCYHADKLDIDCGKEVYEIGACKSVAFPLAYSWPHFLNADERFRRGFEVRDKKNKVLLEPDDDKHGSLLGIEPTTGLTWVYRRRFQINVGFHKGMRDTITEFDYLHKDLIYLPVIWIEMEYDLPAMMGGKPVAFMTFLLRAVIPRLWLLFLFISLVFLAIPTVQRYTKRRENLRQSIHNSRNELDAVDNSLLNISDQKQRK